MARSARGLAGGTRASSIWSWFAVIVTLVAAACTNQTTAAGRSFTPTTAGVLTVATATIPAPGFWVPDGQGGYQGFEADLANQLATRLGLERVEVVQVAFADIVAGRLGAADIALSQVTDTTQREADASFAGPYLTAPPGVLVRAGVEAKDAQELQGLRWLVTYPSTLSAIVTDRIRPNAAPVEVADRDAALQALRDGSADAYLLDLPVAQGIAHDEPSSFAVAGQLSGDEGLSVVLPRGSANVDSVDAAIRYLKSTGTIDDLAKQWLGTTAQDVPLIRVTR